MANKKKDTPAGYDRWDTFSGTVKLAKKPTPQQQKTIDAINAQLKAKKTATKKK